MPLKKKIEKNQEYISWFLFLPEFWKLVKGLVNPFFYQKLKNLVNYFS